MARELLAHGLAQHARAAAVHDAHLAEPGKRRLVDELPCFEPRLVRRATAEDVADVPGFGPVLAAAVVDRLHQGEGGEETATPEVGEVLDAAIPG